MPNFAPLVKAGSKGVDAIVDALRTFKFPQEDAMRLAQQRAALPVEQGGLGLAPTNTAAERAAAMGWKSPTDDFYRGQHAAPLSDSGAPAYNLSGNGVYPSDIYSGNAASYYGHGADELADKTLVSKLQALKDKPDQGVQVFRAVPTSVFKEQGHRLNHGDWVTPSRNYAVEHGEGALKGDYKIISGKVPAKTIFTDGNSLYEFGLDRTQAFADGPASLPVMFNKGFEMTDRSRFAAFDPFRKTAATAAAMGVAAPDLLAQELRKK